MNQKIPFWLLLCSLYFLFSFSSYSQSKLNCLIPASYEEFTVVEYEGDRSFLIGDTLIPVCIYDFEKGEVVFNDFKKFESRTKQKPLSVNTRNLTDGNVEVTNYEQDSLWWDYYYMDRRWEQLDIPVFVQEDDFSESQLREVYWSLKIVENSTLIRFVPIPEDQFCQYQDNSDEPCEHEGNGKKIWYRKIDTSTPQAERDYFIYIYLGDSGFCSAVIGRQINTNFQASGIRLTNACFSTGYVHELLHVLGRVHEQSRYDRDRFIMIDWDAGIHTTTGGQFRRNNLPRTYLEHYGLVNGIVGADADYAYMGKDLQNIKNLVSTNEDKTLMDFSKLYQYDPYFLWGSYFSFNSVMLYNSGYDPIDSDDVPSRKIPYLDHVLDLELTLDQKASSRSLESGDADRVNFLFKYDYLKQSFFDNSDLFEVNEDLPIPAYVRFNYEEEKGYVGLPVDLVEIDNLGIYIVYRRGTFTEENLNPMYGGPQFIPLDYFLTPENLKDREISFDISRLIRSVEVEGNTSLNGFDSKSFKLQIGFYQVDEDYRDINSDKYAIQRYIGPKTEIELTKINDKSFRENNHPLREVKTIVSVLNLYPNPVRAGGNLNIGLSYLSDGMIIEKYNYRYQVMDSAGRVLRQLEGIHFGGDLQLENVDFPPGIYFFHLQSKGEKSSQYTSNATPFIVTP
ncbi:zinc-dependent metalloprotease [Bacteriovoracaceae bacterium]|nr:zinc-dependent metalloprotease [Bacteriovoracaceae bacterium]